VDAIFDCSDAPCQAEYGEQCAAEYDSEDLPYGAAYCLADPILCSSADAETLRTTYCADDITGAGFDTAAEYRVYLEEQARLEAEEAARL